MIPFPMYPTLHVQVKLPGVLVHVALESQLLVVSVHSSISDRKSNTYYKYCRKNRLYFAIAGCSISSVSMETCAVITTRSVGTSSIRTTIITTTFTTFINICIQNAMKAPYTKMMLIVATFTSGSISSVSLVTCTGEVPRSVSTVSIKVTVVNGRIGTLINIC